MSRKAIVFGSSGLVGTHLVQQLVEKEVYTEILLFNRSSQTIENAKVKQVLVDFNKLNTYKQLIKGDVVFCAIGSTIKKAGSKKVFYAIDHDIPVQLSAIAKENKIANFIMVSSLGADTTSSNFYLKTKGETERDVRNNLPDNSFFLRPGLLMGDRKEFRPAEKLAVFFMRIVGKLLLGPLKKYRGISAKKVALAMIRIDLGNAKMQVFESEEIIRLSED